MAEFRNRIEKLTAEAQTLEIGPLEETYKTLSQELQKESFTKAEKFPLERLLKCVRDAIDEKKELAILSLSEDDRNALQQLKDVLGQRKKRRQEIKKQVEELRKMSGGSSLDFEQLMQVSEQTKTEKERLEKADQGIKEIEDKIASVEGKA